MSVIGPLVSFLGTVLMAAAAVLLVRGPVFDGQVVGMLPAVALFAVFLAGADLTFWGTVRYQRY